MNFMFIGLFLGPEAACFAVFGTMSICREHTLRAEGREGGDWPSWGRWGHDDILSQHCSCMSHFLSCLLSVFMFSTG